MLTEADRIVVAVRYPQPVVRALCTLLEAEVVASDHLPIWSARRTTLRAGVNEIEVLSPKGVGVVADFIGRRGPGLFAVGLATTELEKFRSHLVSLGVSFEEGEGQLLVTSDKGVDLPGFNLVISAATRRAPIGLVQRLCGATLLHRFADPANVIRILAIEASRLAVVRPEIPGFTGTVIHLGHDLANHLAILAPWGNGTPIGTFFHRGGPGLYLASAVSDRIAVVRERLASFGQPAPPLSRDGSLLIPPAVFGGARLALFRPAAAHLAWDLSSPIFHPESAEE